MSYVIVDIFSNENSALAGARAYQQSASNKGERVQVSVKKKVNITINDLTGNGNKVIYHKDAYIVLAEG